MNRPGLLLAMIGSLTLTSACTHFRSIPVGNQSGLGGVAVNNAKDVVYVVNGAEDSLTVFSGGSGWRMTLPVPAEPTDVAVMQTTGYVYVTSAKDGLVTILDEAGSLISTLSVCNAPVSLGVLELDTRVFVSCRGSNEIVVLWGGRPGGPGLGSPPSIVQRIPLSLRPGSLAVLESSSSVFVTLVGPDGKGEVGVYTWRLSSVQGPIGKLGKSIPVQGKPTSVAANAHTGEVFVGYDDKGRIDVIDGVLSHEQFFTLTRSIAVDQHNDRLVAVDLAVNESTNALLISYTERAHPAEAYGPLVRVSGANLVVALDERPLTLRDAPLDSAFAATANPLGNKFYVVRRSESAVTEIGDSGVTQDAIPLPIRWCVMQGAAMAGANNPPADQDAVWPAQRIGAPLVQLTDESTRRIWMPSGAHISFFAAAGDDVPVIRDSETVNDILGDIDGTQTPTNREAEKTLERCKLAWQERYPDVRGVAVIWARQISHFSDFGRTVTSPTENSRFSTELCQSPQAVTFGHLPLGIVLSDILPPQASERFVILAHELGHALYLGHGDGLDNDQPMVLPLSPGPRAYDENCDAAETLQAGLMASTAGDKKSLTALQAETARAVAPVYTKKNRKHRPTR